MNNRRNFLKTSMLGAGAFALSPYVNILGANPVTGSSFPKRFVFIRMCNGLEPKTLALPTFSNQDKKKDKDKEALEVALDKHELPNWLKSLNDYKENVTILQGLSSKMSENGHYSFSSVMGCFKSGNSNINSIKRATVDFELAKLFPSPFGHVEFSFANNRRGVADGFSAPAPHQKNFAYCDPHTAYNNLFKSVLKPETVLSDNIMLDDVQNEEQKILQILKGKDAAAYESHLESIQTVQKRNKKLLAMSDSLRKHMPTLGSMPYKADMQNAMTDVIAASLTSGLTNVVTYTIDNLRTELANVPGLGTSQLILHGIGHNSSVNGLEAPRVRELIRMHYIAQVKKLVVKLKAQPEGNGTMFDNTMIMYFPEGGEKHHGTGRELPIVMVSGKNCKLDIAGRYIRLPQHAVAGHKTLGNWYTTLLNAHGNPIHHYGDLDATMSNKKLPQEGAIKNFMRS